MKSRVRLFTLLALGLAACIDGAPTEPGPAGITLLLVSGDGQEGTVGMELPDPLVVRAVGPDGKVLRNQVINFRVAEGGGSVFAGAANTNQHGVAQEYWTLGTAPGRNVLEVRAVDPSSGEKQVFAIFEATGLPVPVASVTLDPAEAVVAEQAELQLNLQLHDAAGNELTDEREVAWTSSDEAIATVTSTGLVTGVSAGPVTIAATVEGHSGEASITVIPAPVASVEVTPDEATLDIGEEVQLTAVARDAGDNELSGRPIAWTSSDEDVATVSPSGLVTAEAGGTAVITATGEGKIGSSQVSVRFPSTPESDVVASITIDPGIVTRGVGESVTLTATLFDAAGLRVSGSHVVVWSTSGLSAFITAQQTVAIDGVTTVQVVGTSGGTTTVSASVGAVSRSINVTFLAPDQFEPNNSGGTATNLGSANDDGPGIFRSASLHSLTDQDWYRVRAVEHSSVVCFPGTTQRFRLTVTLSNIPLGLDYDLEVRMGAVNGPGRSSTASNNTSERVDFDFSGSCGPDDSSDFFIRVYRWSGVPSGQFYLLGATFDRR